MTDPVKMPGRSRWKRLRGETTAPTRKMKEAATGGTVILAGLAGMPSRNRIRKVIKKRPDVKLDAQPPAVAEPAQSPDLAKFMSAFGSLKEKGVFGDNAVEFQREMREEWR